jgi:hypothetical protein
MGAYVSLKDKLTLSKPDPLGLISEERMEELREKARENVRKKLAEKAEKEFLTKEEKRLEQESDPKPEYELRDIIIDAADHTDAIRIDGQYFYYGQKYTVTKPVYDQLMEILARGHAHEREISVPTRRVMSNNRGVVLHGADASGARF